MAPFADISMTSPLQHPVSRAAKRQRFSYIPVQKAELLIRVRDFENVTQTGPFDDGALFA